MRCAHLLALAVIAGCGEPPAPPEPDDAQWPSTARPEILEGLRADLAAERHPGDGGGRAWLASADPATPTAGGRGRFELVYEAGPLGVEVGGSVQLQVSPFWGWSTPQTIDPARPGYTEVETDAAGVELQAGTLGEALLGIRVAGRALAAGERIALVYGAGPEGARVDRFAERDSRFWFAVDADGDGVRAFLDESPAVTVVAGPPAGLVLTLPATARPGESVRLTAAILDASASAGVAFEGRLEIEGGPGLSAPAAIEFEAAHRGRRSVPVTVREPGIHRLRARGPDGLVAESNPLRADPAGPRVLFADLHGHSGLSDGTGLPEDFYAYARDVAALDVAALTDHDHWGMPFLDGSPDNQARIQQATRRFHEPGRFVTLHGFEWTSWVYGHRHVLYFDDEDLRILSSVDPEFDEPRELWEALGDRPALTFAHHSAGGPVGTDWSIPPDPELEPVTEVASVHGSSEALDSPQVIYSPLPGNFVRDVLARGVRLGFVGSSDSHDGHPGLAQLAASTSGLAGILAEELTREAVLEALRARRVYATNGPRIVLDVRLGGRPMGSVVEPGAHTLALRVAAPGPLERVDLVTADGVVLEVALEGERDVAFEQPLPALEAGEVLYVRVVQQDQGTAWSSPFFVEAR